ncbi:hypothetical protein C366_01916 [Cryptococcus neoformans Tu401-1]|nr:hypothetical protein C365_02122 [Cryptococcus neoformans var. grubii Bt85]OXG20383.1 hypothetical protein C366_01916 [Cryptococcus neoformans var. grubii Tu401-1]OXM80250.1 hypothetical protein C364_01874 [Cryptococcus neoformans var. grubii Bt63]
MTRLVPRGIFLKNYNVPAIEKSGTFHSLREIKMITIQLAITHIKVHESEVLVRK